MITLEQLDGMELEDAAEALISDTLVDAAACFDLKASNGGRPYKVLNETGINTVRALAAAFGTEEEVCKALGTDHKTLHNKHNNAAFTAAFEYGKNWGKTKLRIIQFRMARKNASMAIWLGKQYLGQTDQPPASMDAIEDLTPLAELLKEK